MPDRQTREADAFWLRVSPMIMRIEWAHETPQAMSQIDLHTSWPSVYLDQWVWLRLAKADQGEPRETSDLAVLAAMRDASDAGVAFPLSSTHYLETGKITSPQQRAALARPFDPLDRSQAGHWEGDLIIGKDQGSAIGTLVERQTRTVRLLHMPYRDSDTHRKICR